MLKVLLFIREKPQEWILPFKNTNVLLPDSGHELHLPGHDVVHGAPLREGVRAATVANQLPEDLTFRQQPTPQCKHRHSLHPEYLQLHVYIHHTASHTMSHHTCLFEFNYYIFIDSPALHLFRVLTLKF